MQRFVNIPVINVLIHAQHAQPVAVPVPALGLELDVLAQHVEARRAHGLDVKDQRLVGRRRHQPVGPIPLVEHAANEEGLMVETEAGDTLRVRLDAHRAEGAVASDLVQAAGRIGRPIGQAQAIEMGMVRMPELGALDAQPQANGLGGRPRARLRHDLLVSVEQGDRKLSPRHAQMRRHVQNAGIGIGGQSQRLDVMLGHLFQPDALPDAALGGVPHSLRMKGLFAAGVEGCI